MKIGITSSCIESGRFSGVKVQGIMWRDSLVSRGHEAVLINYWDDVNYKEFDAIIVLRMGVGMRNVCSSLSVYNVPIISAPIFDPNKSMTFSKLSAKYGHIDKLNMATATHYAYEAVKYVSMFLVRSEYEKKYLSYCLDIPEEKIELVPLSFRLKPADTMPEKENFCFHVSNLNAVNKNVPRLIEAAKKYGFELVLGGSVKGSEGKKKLDELIGGSKNITYVGQLSDNDLGGYYRRAKVFALPSLWEGVGFVALEAAACGCGIVLTNHGAPKSYYNGLAELVNPKSSDEIGRAVMKLLNSPTDSRLMEHVKANYSPENCSRLLEEACLRASECNRHQGSPTIHEP